MLCEFLVTKWSSAARRVPGGGGRGTSSLREASCWCRRWPCPLHAPAAADDDSTALAFMLPLFLLPLSLSPSLSCICYWSYFPYIFDHCFSSSFFAAAIANSGFLLFSCSCCLLHASVDAVESSIFLPLKMLLTLITSTRSTANIHSCFCSYSPQASIGSAGSVVLRFLAVLTLLTSHFCNCPYHTPSCYCRCVWACLPKLP